MNGLKLVVRPMVNAIDMMALGGKSSMASELSGNVVSNGMALHSQCCFACWQEGDKGGWGVERLQVSRGKGVTINVKLSHPWKVIAVVVVIKMSLGVDEGSRGGQ